MSPRIPFFLLKSLSPARTVLTLTLPNRKPEDRPTAATLLRESDFCVIDPDYDFMNTQLAAKLSSGGLVSLGE